MTNLFQSQAWEEFKLKSGYQASFWVDGILVLKKALTLGYSMLYSPMVQEFQVPRTKYQEFIEKIRKLALEQNAIFYRLELDIPSVPTQIPNTKYQIVHGFRRAFEEMQPEHTLVLDLKQSETDLLAQMSQKGRYNIRVAERNNIKITSGTEKRLVDNFYALYQQTGKRHRITYRSKSYFENLVEILSKLGYVEIYQASISSETCLNLDDNRLSQCLDNLEEGNQKVLCSAIIVFSGKKAIYLFGASSDAHKQFMPTYALHWQIIKEMKAKGFTEYDFFGIAPNDDPKHPWAGVTQFKKRFGGKEISILGSYDLTCKPVQYQLFKIAEKLRRH
ncbi:MAG TPA: peptidoglycan bridge formation glycyltransferase FemA/FemB family protein [bacterium]|nr:peptidoglycan bridge formation glycyltransferase FemA/FemB family protein [bacterium]